MLAKLYHKFQILSSSTPLFIDVDSLSSLNGCVHVCMYETEREMGDESENGRDEMGEKEREREDEPLSLYQNISSLQLV